MGREVEPLLIPDGKNLETAKHASYRKFKTTDFVVPDGFAFSVTRIATFAVL
jgi:hypothetical protein